MAKKGRGQAHVGGHGWFVTFADLMGLLMSFFVMLVAFSTQDQQKLNIVAGSMREAFGVQTETRFSGIVEVDGLPTRARLKHTEKKPIEDPSSVISPDEKDRQRTSGARLQADRAFALAAATLRQALQDMPDFGELSKNLLIEESRHGLNIELADQDGRSMFAEGSKEPYERTRRVLQKIATALKAMPNRISIAGHTSASRLPPDPTYGPWELSADRANAVRQVLANAGVPATRFAMIAGRADTEPLFAEDPYLAANRRVTITLMHEAPPLPPGFKP
ncbi:MAG: chemotaxis protein MotB [Variibacter sp.]|jgi:chemotaxis protein MotB|nr:chemotaxis protein MotB [Variibacter sp.]